MSKSPLISEGDLPTYKILVDGQPIKDFYQVVSIHTEKEINTISTAQIILMDGEVATENFSISESDDFVPGKKIEIQMGYHATDKPIYTGIIMAQQIKVRSSVNRLIAQLTVKCSDEALKLTVAKNNITFKDKKDSDAITSILAKAGIAKTVETTEFQYPKLVQYDCTDWDFILSRAEINGFIVLCNDGKLDIGKPRLDGNSILSLTYGKDVIDFQGELDAQSQLQSVLSKSWDSSQQKVLTGNSIEPNVNPHGNITGKKLSEVLNSGIYEIHTTVPEDASVLKTWANAKLQKSRLAKLRGYVTFSGNADPLPGKIIELNGFGQRMNGKAYISKVLHTFESGIWTTHVGFGLSPKWFSETKQLVSPTAKGLLPGIQGLQTGVVKQLDQDPDGEFRILVTVPMIEEAGDGIWARLTHEYASNEIGTFFLPEIGDEVVLGFLNEDPRFPVIMGMLYSKTKAPPYTPAAENNTKAIITKSKLKLIFDEEKKIITIETPGANKIIISDDGKSITLQDQNSNKVVLSDSGISLDSPKDITVSAKGKFSIDAMGITLNSKADVTVEGNNINAKAKMAFAAQGTSQASLKATGQVEVKGGMVMIN